MAGYIANVPEVRWLHIHLSGVGVARGENGSKTVTRLLLLERTICKLSFLSNYNGLLSLFMSFRLKHSNGTFPLILS